MGRHRAGWWCSWSLHFAHRLQSFATDWHFLLVVVIVALFLSNKQLITVAREIGRAFCHFRLGIGRINCRLSHCCCMRCMRFNFRLLCCGRLFCLLHKPQNRNLFLNGIKFRFIIDFSDFREHSAFEPLRLLFSEGFFSQYFPFNAEMNGLNGF